MTCLPTSVIVFLSAATVFAGTAGAQYEAEDAEQPSAATIDYTFNAGFEYQMGTGIDDGGDFDVARPSIGLSARTSLMDDLDLTLLLNYEFSAYEFDGETNFGGRDPWDSIHQIGIGALFTLTPTDDWAIFGGPLFRFAMETDADFEDSFTGGGLVGASHRFSDELLIGAGLGVVSQIEDSNRFFPVFILDWEILDDLRLTSRTSASAVGRTGIELVYSATREWDIAIGGAYETRRFRLDSDGVAPDGVGKETGYPIWARLSYGANPNLDLNLYAGIVVGGDLSLDDSSGHQLGSEDFEPAGLFGVSASIRF